MARWVPAHVETLRAQSCRSEENEMSAQPPPLSARITVCLYYGTYIYGALPTPIYAPYLTWSSSKKECMHVPRCAPTTTDTVLASMCKRAVPCSSVATPGRKLLIASSSRPGRARLRLQLAGRAR